MRRRSVKLGFLRQRVREPDVLPSPQPFDFLGLDFETANTQRGSACAVGVVVVRSGSVVAEGATLINPEVPFDSYCTWVNGIDEEAVRGAPTFPEVWPRLAGLLRGARVVMHNASFDISVLRNTAGRYGVEIGPEFEFFCTYRLARLVWPSLPSYSLRYLAPALGIDFEHHLAGEDARACAQVAVAMCDESGVSDLLSLTNKLGVFPGRLAADSYTPFSFARPGGLGNVVGREDANPSHPLFGKSICFTGALVSMTRREAMQRVTDVGCNFRSSVSKTLDYLVIGDGDFVQFAGGWQTGKLKKAVGLRLEGASTEIIPEQHFLELLQS